jgi:energy-dependent translational throttle protein EttA
VSAQYIFTMHRLSKVHPPDKEVLKDITLAFLPGAKIGVLGAMPGSVQEAARRLQAYIDAGKAATA